MSSRAKHALRSHRSHSNKAAIFSKFEVKASKIKQTKQLKEASKKVPLLDKIKNLFKHQSR